MSTSRQGQNCYWLDFAWLCCCVSTFFFKTVCLTIWECMNEMHWRSSNVKTPSEYFSFTQSWSLAFMRHHSSFTTIYIWCLRGNYSRWYLVGVISQRKVTAMKGVKLAPGTIISHTNHAVAFPSSNSKLLLPIVVLSKCCLLQYCC